MSYRRSAISVSPVNTDSSTSLECQICHNYDSLFVCTLCKRFTCYWDIIIVKNGNDFCKLCLNDSDKMPFILPLINIPKKKCSMFSIVFGCKNINKIQPIQL